MVYAVNVNDATRGLLAGHAVPEAGIGDPAARPLDLHVSDAASAIPVAGL